MMQEVVVGVDTASDRLDIHHPGTIPAAGSTD
jgi:hypothetical protein